MKRRSEYVELPAVIRILLYGCRVAFFSVAHAVFPIRSMGKRFGPEPRTANLCPLGESTLTPRSVLHACRQDGLRPCAQI